MTLPRAVECQHLASQLTETETKSFINNVAESNPKIIIHILSTHFIHQSSHQSSGYHFNSHCNEHISSIIQSRDPDDADISNLVDLKLHKLPRRLIGNCGSFLDQRFYRKLSLCNRSIYLGCNTPIMLNEVKVRYHAPPYCRVPDLSTFTMAKKLDLSFDIDKKGKLPSPINMNIIAA